MSRVWVGRAKGGVVERGKVGLAMEVQAAIAKEYVSEVQGIVNELGAKYEALGGTDMDWLARHIGPLVSLRTSAHLLAIDVDGKRVWTRKINIRNIR